MTAKKHPAHFVQRAKERAGLTETQALAVYKDIPRAVALYDACDPVGIQKIDFMRAVSQGRRLFRIRVSTGHFAVVVDKDGMARTIMTLAMAKEYVPKNRAIREKRIKEAKIRSRQTRLPA